MKQIYFMFIFKTLPMIADLREKQQSVKFLQAFTKLRKPATSFVMSVRPYGATRYPLEGFHEIL